MTWAILAILFSIGAAAFSEVNRIFKMDGIRLNFWRSLIKCSLLVPVLFFVEWPKDMLFYIVSVVEGFAIMYCSLVLFNLAAKQNGRVACLYMPFKAFFMFFLWFVISPESLQDYVNNPWLGVGVFACLTIATVAMGSMRSNDASWQAFISILPVGVVYGVMEVVVKKVMTGADLLDMVLIFTFIYTFVMIIISGSILLLRPKSIWFAPSPLCPPGMLKAASIIAVLSIINSLLVFTAIPLSPNPAYVGAIAMLAPAWLMIYHKLTGLKDDASPVAGLVMVASAIALVVIVSI